MAIWNTQIIAQAVLFVKSGFMGGEREKDMKIQRYEIQRYGTGNGRGVTHILRRNLPRERQDDRGGRYVSAKILTKYTAL